MVTRRSLVWIALASVIGAFGACVVARVKPATPKSASNASVALDAGDTTAEVDASLAPDDGDFTSLRAPIESAIAEGKMPGCVVLVGRHDRVLFRRAYGSRSIEPTRTPMTEDTLFDLASLTKPIATATSIMILVEHGKVSLDAPAAKYVPELASLPPFTVRQLLLHESGLVADTPKEDYANGREDALRKIASHKMAAGPAEKYIYSDAGFIVLGEIVRRVSGEDLATFAHREIFAPLGMNDTEFNPTGALKTRAAPTEERDGGWMIGDVHDPRAWGLGGVAGHAGLFSTADDLARFARAMLGRGELETNTGPTRIFSRATASLFFTRDPKSFGGRTLGWDGTSHVFSPHAFGHGGFTGTSLWIDPDRDLFVVFLSNRVHPDGKGIVNPLIAEIDALAIDASTVTTGIDALRADHFGALRGARIGLLTNTSAKTRDGTTTIDTFQSADAHDAGVKLAAIFSPEHGVSVDHDAKVADGALAGIPVHSLYGARLAPDASSLDGLDALVVDLQDVGVRFYTYASTMRRAMRAAFDHHVRFVVLDRPNPLGGALVQGPVFSGTPTFVNHAQLPVRHGMTMGELATMFAHDDGTKVEVIAMRHWHRADVFDATGLAWTSPSPNLRSLAEVILYPALGLIEGTNVSVGRGTETPFEHFGAPWIDGAALASDLAAAHLAGVTFAPTTFTPSSAKYAHEICHGVRVTVTDRDAFDPMRTAVAIALALHARYPTWKLDDMSAALGSATTLEAIRRNADATEITRAWNADLDAFRIKRAQFLLYR